MALTLSGLNITGRTSMGADIVPVLPDPYYSNVSLLLHGDGTQGSTTIVDNSSTPTTFSLPGSNLFIDTATKVYGTGSIYFNSQAMGTPTNAKFDLTQGDFTFETRVNMFTFNGGMLASHRNVSGNNGWQVRINTNATVSFWYTGGTVCTTSATVPSNTWTAVAVTRSGTTVRIFINGTLVQSFTGIINGTTATTSDFRCGGDEAGTGKLYAYLDEYRITKGVARYTSTYSLATDEFPNS